ncbi:class I SAM-dependent methyltransferase [Candidatus Poribacteria bacterium]
MNKTTMELSRQQIAYCYDELARSGKFPDSTLLHQTLLKLIMPDIQHPTSLDVLDAGSGAGFFGTRFAESGHRTTLLDPSMEALNVARNRCRGRGYSKRISLVAGDVECLPFRSGSFDIVVCIFVFSHLSDPDRAMGELRRVLRRRGRLLVSFENKLWHAIASGLRERYGEAKSLLSSENPVVKAYEILPPVRLYSASEIESLCHNHGLRIIDFTGMRYLTSFQEPLKDIGTTDAEYLLRDNLEAQELENLLSESGELLNLARHFLLRCEPEDAV